MTAIAHPAQHLRDARRDAEALKRRQEALARLAARRMPLPGRHIPHQAAQPGLGHRAGHPHLHRVPAAPARPAVSDGGSQAASGRAKPNLTAREIEVLRTWMLVDSKPAVAKELYISLGTVNTHLTRIRAKYAEIGRPAPTKASLVARAIQDGIMSLDEL
ncbi:helix-turn-helix transcriptional regulator [Gordonia paraffinivorans]|uniref:helix-turn-helix transcriptional regulator n=1 Tax=Gordonia paraffinivorans TaxID=175628 RepID=UPI000D605B84|nr:LuxR C-terminal-related transcriptional regulator [Gordonia paraffinivorans]MBY4572340.1 LuxR family transcriptional regulator [Gordonia paraffinivorans]PWD43124.1 LuxR family transcriptional regulator [Gordonia paraffinivorans]